MSTPSAQTSDQNRERIDVAFKHYRQILVAMSVSVMTLSFTVLSWLLTTNVALSCYMKILATLFFTTTIAVAVFIQLCVYQGYKLQARTYFDSTVNQTDANRWFKRGEDTAVWLLCSCFVVGVIITVVALLVARQRP